MTYLQAKTRTFEILEPASAGDKASRVFDVFIISVISLNLLALVIETIDPIYERFSITFVAFEVVSVGIFTIEYLLRLWACTASSSFSSPIAGRVRFALRPILIFDLLAILPFYLPFFGIDFRFLRAARLYRLLRVAKLARYSSALQRLGSVFQKKKEELIVTLSFVFVLLLFASCLIYFAERDAQPKVF